MFNSKDWIGWVGALMVTLATAICFVFGTFQTRGEAKDFQGFITQRLDRLEHKIDLLFERKEK